MVCKAASAQTTMRVLGALTPPPPPATHMITPLPSAVHTLVERNVLYEVPSVEPRVRSCCLQQSHNGLPAHRPCVAVTLLQPSSS